MSSTLGEQKRASPELACGRNLLRRQLHFGFPKAGPHGKDLREAIYLSGDSRNHWKGMGKETRKGRQAVRLCYQAGFLCGHWSLTSLVGKGNQGSHILPDDGQGSWA